MYQDTIVPLFTRVAYMKNLGLLQRYLFSMISQKEKS